MDKANAELSKHVHEVLDVIGASQSTRKKYWEFAMLNEIPITFLSNLYPKQFGAVSTYQVGSRCEGTTTTDLNSDLDNIWCYEDCPVVENLESELHGFSFLILTDEENKPGYVLLQLVEDGCPLKNKQCDDIRFELDRKGRVCAKHFLSTPRPNTCRNGPAETIQERNYICPMDLVCTYRCRQIPRSVNSWIHRTRKYDWPSQKQLKAMSSYGCFLVGVGHPHSAQKYIEWKFSFSLQERNLMSNLNETQHKCYILLKMIKKDIIESKVGESISSYHCKTSLLYTIENSPRHIWKYGNLILCVRLCLVRLLNWVKERKCPNYFIPDDNLFDKLSSMTLTYTEDTLYTIIDSGVIFLYSIVCDNIGELLNFKSKMHGFDPVCSQGNMGTFIGLPRLIITIAESVYAARNNLLERIHVSCNIHLDYTNRTKYLLLYLQSTNHVTEHTTRDVRMVLDSLIPHIQLQYQQCLFAQYLTRGVGSSVWSKTMPNVISETSDCDLISSKLSLASVYIQTEHLQEQCKRILVSSEKGLEPHVVSVCQCHTHKKSDINPALAEKLRITDMLNGDFRRHCITCCMVFHPSQVSLVHAALHYELFRTVYTQPGLGSEKLHMFWLNMITVDSQIYLYFLQYLLYSKTKQRTEKDMAMHKLKHLLVTDPDLGHSETGWNLFGWICLQEKALQAAWRYLCVSWKIRPLKNAAKWHMLILLSETTSFNLRY